MVDLKESQNEVNLVMLPSNGCIECLDSFTLWPYDTLPVPGVEPAVSCVELPGGALELEPIRTKTTINVNNTRIYSLCEDVCLLNLLCYGSLLNHFSSSNNFSVVSFSSMLHYNQRSLFWLGGFIAIASLTSWIRQVADTRWAPLIQDLLLKELFYRHCNSASSRDQYHLVWMTI